MSNSTLDLQISLELAATMSNSTLDLQISLELAQDEVSAYYRAHYGPMWGDENEAAVKPMYARIAALRTELEKRGVEVDEWYG